MPPKPHGVTMKVVLRGSRRAGKTSLFKRLKGEPFVSEYSLTKDTDVRRGGKESAALGGLSSLSFRRLRASHGRTRQRTTASRSSCGMSL